MNSEEGKTLNHLIQMEHWIILLLKRLDDQDKMSEKKRVYPSGSKPRVLYGLAKISKALEDWIQSFCPIL